MLRYPVSQQQVTGVGAEEEKKKVRLSLVRTSSEAPLATSRAPAEAHSDGPASYASNANCRWTFRGSAPVVVDIRAMETESGYDWLTVHDGDSSSAPQLGRYSGTEGRGIRLTSTGTSITIVLEADGSIEGSGFEAMVTSSGASASVPVPAFLKTPGSEVHSG